jgi:thioesterase domain-containing protein
MTHSILDSVAANGRSHIVPLRTSDAGSPPLFCFPGSNGSVLVFQEMATTLPEGYPVYGIEMDSLVATDEQFTIEQLSSFYLDVIRKIQGTGPYYFCGYSFGGLVAYEMAMRLIEEGDRANLVALLDAPNPAHLKNISVADSMEFHKTYMVDRLKQYGQLLLRGDIATIRRKAFALLLSRFGFLFVPVLKFGFRMVRKPLPLIFRANDPNAGFLKAWRSYVPKQSDQEVVLFRTQDRGPEYDLDPSMGWNACVNGGLQIHIIPGGHLDMMSMPAVRVVAEKLAAYLDNGSNLKESTGTA